MKRAWLLLCLSAGLTNCTSDVDAIDDGTTPSELVKATTASFERAYNATTMPLVSGSSETVDTTRILAAAKDFNATYIELVPGRRVSVGATAGDNDNRYMPTIESDLLPAAKVDAFAAKFVFDASYASYDAGRKFFDDVITLFGNGFSKQIVGINFDDFYAKRNAATSGSAKFYSLMKTNLVSAGIIAVDASGNATHNSMRVMATVYCQIPDSPFPSSYTGQVDQLVKDLTANADLRAVLTDVVIYDQAELKAGDGPSAWQAGDVGQVQGCVQRVQSYNVGAVGSKHPLAIRVGIYDAGPDYQFGVWKTTDAISVQKSRELAARLLQIRYGQQVTSNVRGYTYFELPLDQHHGVASTDDGEVSYIDSDTYSPLYATFECIGAGKADCL